MPYKQSANEGVPLTTKRRDGNTTRCIDNAIQLLFDGKTCIVIDHHGKERCFDNMYLHKRILNRLDKEHSLTKENGEVIETGNNGSYELTLAKFNK